jgi:hypothetical protein
MVDSPKEKTMTNGADNLPERVQAIEEKLDALASSVDRRFEQVDRRFDRVDAAIVEQRAYTEFAYAVRVFVEATTRMPQSAAGLRGDC